MSTEDDWSQAKMQSHAVSFSSRQEIGGSAFDIPIARWRRNQDVDLRAVERVAVRGPRLSGAGNDSEPEGFEFVVNGEGGLYSPLVDEPAAYLQFAKLVSGSTDDMKAFIHRFGLPTGSNRLGLNRFLHEVVELWNAVTLHAAALEDDQDSLSRLAAALRQNLYGVRLLPAVWGDPPRIGSFYAPIDLLSAMWLQLLDTVIEKKLIRQACPNCNNPFISTDPRQIYCSPSCRHAFAQRNYMKRNPRRRKEPNSGAQD